MPVLIAFGTIEGQTGKIARFVRDLLQAQGEDVCLHDTASLSIGCDPGDFSATILAASVHERRHPPEFETFVKAHAGALHQRPTLLLSVSLSAAFEEGLEEAQDYVDEMRLRTGLDPDAQILVAGAIRRRHYGVYETQVLKHVVLRDRTYDTGAATHEFTAWDDMARGVRAFRAKQASDALI